MARPSFARPVSTVQAAWNVRAGSKVRAVAGVASIQLHDDLWRITRTDGEVLGYVEHAATQAGSRFTAKRMVQR
ncbi:MAG: DUF2163 domain-containing protein, partial [Salinibacterium sp.]|nr:DUF2163 domain-containing protein [Salinibacterium sp.]